MREGGIELIHQETPVCPQCGYTGGPKYKLVNGKARGECPACGYVFFNMPPNINDSAPLPTRRCPFCGKGDQYVKMYDASYEETPMEYEAESWVLWCECGAAMRSYRSEEDAIDKWNGTSRDDIDALRYSFISPCGDKSEGKK